MEKKHVMKHDIEQLDPRILGKFFRALILIDNTPEGAPLRRVCRGWNPDEEELAGKSLEKPVRKLLEKYAHIIQDNRNG